MMFRMQQNIFWNQVNWIGLISKQKNNKMNRLKWIQYLINVYYVGASWLIHFNLFTKIIVHMDFIQIVLTNGTPPKRQKKRCAHYVVNINHRWLWSWLASVCSCCILVAVAIGVDHDWWIFNFDNGSTYASVFVVTF